MGFESIIKERFTSLNRFMEINALFHDILHFWKGCVHIFVIQFVIHIFVAIIRSLTSADYLFNKRLLIIQRISYWSLDLVLPAGLPPPWPPLQADRGPRRHNEPLCNGSSESTRTAASGRGWWSSPAAGAAAQRHGQSAWRGAASAPLPPCRRVAYLHTGQGGVLVRFHHSVVGLHVHQPQQKVLPPPLPQNLQDIAIPYIWTGIPPWTSAAGRIWVPLKPAALRGPMDKRMYTTLLEHQLIDQQMEDKQCLKKLIIYF